MTRRWMMSVWAASALVLPARGGVMSAAPTVDEVIKALNDSREDVQQMAIGQLAGTRDPAMVPALLLARHKADRYTRSMLDDTLMDVAGPQSVDALIAAVADPEVDTRHLAVRALGKIGDVRAYEALLGATKDPNGNVRGAAIEALGQLGDPRAVDGLLVWLDQDDATLRDAAHKALVACAGADYGVDVHKWAQRGTKYKEPALRLHAAWISGRLLIPRALFVAALTGLAVWIGRPVLWAAAYALPLVVLALLAQVHGTALERQVLTAAVGGFIYFWLFNYLEGGGLSRWAVALPGIVILASV